MNETMADSHGDQRGGNVAHGRIGGATLPARGCGHDHPAGVEGARDGGGLQRGLHPAHDSTLATCAKKAAQAIGALAACASLSTCATLEAHAPYIEVKLLTLRF